MKHEIHRLNKIQWAHSPDIKLKVAVHKTVINVKWKISSFMDKIHEWISKISKINMKEINWNMLNHHSMVPLYPGGKGL